MDFFNKVTAFTSNLLSELQTKTAGIQASGSSTFIPAGNDGVT